MVPKIAIHLHMSGDSFNAPSMRNDRTCVTACCMRSRIIHGFCNEGTECTDCELRCIARWTEPLSKQSQTWTGHTKRGQADCFALDAAAMLLLSDDCLNVFRACPSCLLLLARVPIEAVGFEMAAFELHQSFEAHCE